MKWDKVNLDKPGFVSEIRVHGTTFHRALLVQRNNNVVIWIVIPLCTFNFFRESYCLCLTDRMRSSKKKKIKDTLKINCFNSGAPS